MKKNKPKPQPVDALEIGQKVYYSDGKSMMDVLKVKSTNEEGYIFDNGMKANWNLERIDSPHKGYKEKFFPANPENDLIYEAHYLQQRLPRELESISKHISSMNKMELTLEQAEILAKFDKYINKIKKYIP